MENSQPPRTPYRLRSRPHNFGSWLKSRRRRKDKKQKRRFMQKVIARCHFCDCEYDTRRYEKCYKCGASEGDRSFTEKLRQAGRSFWRWFH